MAKARAARSHRSTRKAAPAARHTPTFPQARARATRRALLDAARDVFSAHGYDEVQTPDIAAAARVSVGTFYRYFDDKRQVFVEMIRAHLAEGHELVMARLTRERFAGADTRKSIDLVLAALFDYVLRFPSLMRLATQMAVRDPEVAEARRLFEERAEEAVAALIAGLVPRKVIPDPRAAAIVLHRATIEVALAPMLDERRGKRASEAAVRLALREMIHRYLFPSR